MRSHGSQQSVDLAKVGVPVERGTGRVSQARTAGSTLRLVDTKQEIREFLTSRRARITPEQAGLASYGSRRVPGLRREEVAVLAGVSVPYYTRLERGDLSGASESVLEALARALQLDDAERAHLFDLARAAHPTPARPRRRQTKPRVRPEVQWTLDAITGAAAFVSNERLDILAANQLGSRVLRAVHRTGAAGQHRPVRLPRPASRGVLRRLGPRRHRIRRHPALCRRSRPIQPRPLRPRRRARNTERSVPHRWAAHNVRFHNTGVKHFNHPDVGELHLSYVRLDLAADPGLTIFTYTAEPGSRSDEALKPSAAGQPRSTPPSRRTRPTRAEAAVMGGARLEQAASCFRAQVLRSSAAAKTARRARSAHSGCVLLPFVACKKLPHERSTVGSPPLSCDCGSRHARAAATPRPSRPSGRRRRRRPLLHRGSTEGRPRGCSSHTGGSGAHLSRRWSSTRRVVHGTGRR